MSELRDKLKHNAVMMQVPLGLEADHVGVIDLVEMRALIWSADTPLGEAYGVEEIPSTHVEAAREWRDRLLETLGEELP